LEAFQQLSFLQGRTVSPTLEDQNSVFMTPGDRVAQLHPPGTG
jgi:hypothetical protein